MFAQIPVLPFDLKITDEKQMVCLAEDVASILRSGDVIALSGDLGAGKSTFCRALLRAFANDPFLEVPSPTFTLVQTYELNRLTLSHFDLYRLEEPEELLELGLEEVLSEGAALIEWPQKAEELLPKNSLWLEISHEGDDDRRFVSFKFQTDEARKGWADRLQRTMQSRALMEKAGLAAATRRHLVGDASTRRYERLTSGHRKAILMDSPAAYELAKNGDEPSYGQLVHRARTLDAFLAVGEELRRRGYSAPHTLLADRGNGLLVLEDLGAETIVDSSGDPIKQRYMAAVELLADMHGQSDWPRTTGISDSGVVHEIPDYSEEALLTEADLFLEWYLPWKSGGQGQSGQMEPLLRAEYHALWRNALDMISSAEQGWILRDYHSPNILWLAERDCLKRVGLIDYQDCVWGAVAYDLASLLLDARTDISEELEKELFASYIYIRKKNAPDFDSELFAAAYAVMGAHRIIKILGLFVRLNLSENKPGYMRHLPRMEGYLERALRHPVMKDLKQWFECYGTK